MTSSQRIRGVDANSSVKESQLIKSQGGRVLKMGEYLPTYNTNSAGARAPPARTRARFWRLANENRGLGVVRRLAQGRQGVWRAGQAVPLRRGLRA